MNACAPTVALLRLAAVPENAGFYFVENCNMLMLITYDVSSSVIISHLIHTAGLKISLCSTIMINNVAFV